MPRFLAHCCTALLCFAGLQTAGAQFQKSDPRNVALKQVAEAQQSVTEAQAAVVKAQKALEGTEGEQRKTAERLLAEAQEKLAAARRELARRNTDVLNAAAQASNVSRAAAFGSALPEREHADPQDPLERFALLAPGGPVIVQVALTIDGQPFRMSREKLIDEMLAAADKDGDGQVRWEEALAAPRFTLGQVRSANAQAERSLNEFWDKNSDGLVDRAEVRHFLAQRFQGAAFSIGGLPNYAGRSGRVLVGGQYTTFGAVPDVLPLLDADQDGSVSAAEMTAAAERLKSRDADDNDLLFPTELALVPVAEALRRLPQPDPPAAVLLGPTLNADSLFTLLGERYKVETGPIPAERFPAVPELFKALDDDGDGKLQKFEAIGINDVEPQIAIAVDLGTKGGGKGLSITSLAAEVAEGTKAAGGDALALPGVRVSMTANTAVTAAVNYDVVAGSYINRLDKDGNAYLEKSEAGNLGEQFALWDGDGDGKVYAKEIAAAYAAMAAPQATRVVAQVSYLGSSLFQLLDTNGDGRLGAREMRAAAERTRSLDKDASGSITADEIPATINVSFSLGNAGFQAAQRTGPAAIAAAGTPDWFQRMDRNLDGDLSLREFLGDEQDFKRLDANGDGLIDPREAEAVENGK